MLLQIHDELLISVPEHEQKIVEENRQTRTRIGG